MFRLRTITRNSMEKILAPRNMLVILAFFSFIWPFYVSLVMNTLVFLYIFKKFGWMKALILPGLILALLLADNLVQGNQDYFRSVVWAFQGVLLLYYYNWKD